MKSHTKIIIIILVAFLILLIFAGCKKRNIKEIENNQLPKGVAIEHVVEHDKVEIVTYLLGEPDVGYEKVYAEVNKKLEADINATLKVNILGWDSWNTEYPLVLASGELIDLIYTTKQTFYNDEVQKGSFMALDEMLPKYAPILYEGLSDVVREEAKVDGVTYMIPYNDQNITAFGYLIRGDLRKKYSLPEIKNDEDFERYLQAIKDNEPNMIPYNAGKDDTNIFKSSLILTNDWSWVGFKGGIFSKLNNSEVFAWYLTDEFSEFVTKNKEWADKGFWNKNVLSNNISSSEAFGNGTSGATIVDIYVANDLYNKVKAQNPSWEVEWYEIGSDTIAEVTSSTLSAFSIPVTAKNPERTLMALELLKHNEEYYDLIHYGIKGEHFDLDNDGYIIIPKGFESYNGKRISIWGFNNNDFQKYSANLMPTFIKDEESMMSRAKSSSYASFSFNVDDIKIEISTISDVIRQYTGELTWGLVDDPTETLAEFEEELMQSGLDIVLAEAKIQSTNYLK